MQQQEKVCQACGWRNDGDARMCGGCGQPLRSSVAGATTALAPTATPGWYGTPNAASGPGGPAGSTEAPTVWGATTRVAGVPPALPAIPAHWPAQPQNGTSVEPLYPTGHPVRPARRRRNGCVTALVTLLVVLGLLAGGVVAAWTLVVRPALHTQVDSALRSKLDGAVDAASPQLQLVQALPAGQYTVDIPASSINAQVAPALPPNSSVQRPTVHFIPAGGGSVQLSYMLAGHQEQVTTRLVLHNNRLQAESTTVNGWLGFVESDSEMQSALNEALGRLPTVLRIASMHVANDTLSITIQR